MAGHSLPQETVARIVELRSQCLSQRAIAENLGVAQSAVSDHLKRAAERGELGTTPVLDGFRISQTTAVMDADGSVVREFVQQKPERGDPFEVPAGHAVKGVSALVDQDGRVIQQWVKTREGMDPAWTKDALLEVFSDIRAKSELCPLDKPAIVNHDLLTTYITTDLHVGMLAWGKETGTPWDLAIAKETIFNSMNDLICSSPASGTAILLDLGDQVHANDQSNATPASGHQLDVDGRFQKIVKETLRLRKVMVELALQKHQKVIYRGLPGNHDPEVARMLTLALALFFENNPRVVVDDDPGEFWFYEHGIVMLCGNHGHKTKPDALPGVMAGYRPEMWGRTKVRQAFSGHVHHTRAGEANGARWETLRTISARDAFAHSHGYTAGRELISLTYHRDRGLRSRQVVEII